MKQSYEQAFSELEKIVSELEKSEETNIDELNNKVKRAGELLTICKKKLYETDVELEKILEQIN
ncbi:MAG: exodeoxyribonuclease VII small subunit [Paludibacter sp.]|nr:exodeoxyribonuclease VII small subunit [Paludibacter sp.]